MHVTRWGNGGQLVTMQQILNGLLLKKGSQEWNMDLSNSKEIGGWARTNFDHNCQIRL